MVRRVTGLLALLLVLVYATGLSAQAKKVRLEKKLMEDSLVFNLKVNEKDSVPQGKTFKVKINVKGSDKWHPYSPSMDPDAGPSPMELKIPADLQKLYQVVKVEESPKPTEKFDENFDAMTKAHYGPFTLTVTVKVKPDAPVGRQPFGLHVTYMTCSESICLPDRTFDVPMVEILKQQPAFVNIIAGKDKAALDSVRTADSLAALAAAASIPKDPTTADKTKAAGGAQVADADAPEEEKKTAWQFLAIAVLSGLGALLTPCVYPMVPITVSFFTKRNAGSKKEAVKDAFMYGFGIIFTFVALGLLLTTFLGRTALADFASNAAVNLVVAAIFVIFALNLFGLFEIGLPSGILTKLNKTAQGSKNKSLSVLLMGFVFSLTSFTCTVPFFSNLVFAFHKGETSMALMGMTAYATVFALPFFLLALFPSLLKAMPRSGGWMNSVKVVMGFLELGAALKFISNADLVLAWEFFNRDLILAAWIAIAILITVYLLGRFQLSHDSPVEHIGAGRVMLATFFLSAGIYLYTGLHGRPLGKLDAFLPPMDYASASFTPMQNASAGGPPIHTAKESHQWHERFNEALAEAKRTNKNVFVDFTGYTCTNCRAMESTVFQRPEVKELFNDFVLARLYTDNGSPLNDSNRTMEEERFNTIALPYYVIISPDDKALGEFPGYTDDHASFTAFLAKHRKAEPEAIAEVQ
ncbi:MAG TPA: cytochrome c biogenesis protein CcdA [Candidatus Kapabacteria bacterium]|nr:cytochrome c biogenesis protein CcdA [Candidatus Kapabacteria bacterium]